MAVRDEPEALLFEELRKGPRRRTPLAEELLAFSEFGSKTVYTTTTARTPSGKLVVDTFVNEFWTGRQRAAHRLHEISYRACFKPQLPAFFIERLTWPGELVHDPFMGRGTTPIEAALRGRVPLGSDANPLSAMLVRPRLRPPTLTEVAERLAGIPMDPAGELPEELLVFYHRETLAEICGLREYLLARQAAGELDDVDAWIRMVALNRLTGHSPGFFSVYTLPPNQAVSVRSQQRINARRKQVPPRRDVRRLIERKSRSLLSDLTAEDRQRLRQVAGRALLLTAPAAATPEIASGSVALVVTSPPFLDVVQYEQDNWLRCWFAGIDAGAVAWTVHRDLRSWQAAMTEAFVELRRVLRPGGHIAFEVGEVRKGSLRLEEAVLPCAVEAGLEPELVLIQEQEFTKTANCWGVSNNRRGTNSNRIVLLRRGDQAGSSRRPPRAE